MWWKFWIKSVYLISDFNSWCKMCSVNKYKENNNVKCEIERIERGSERERGN